MFGYLIMEYIDGQLLSATKDPDSYLKPMAKILSYSEQI